MSLYRTRGYELTIRAGSSLAEKGGQIVGISSMCDHPKYNGTIYDYDISLILLNQTLILGTNVQTIPLQPTNLEVATGTMATVTGWGRLAFRGPLPEKLQVVQVPKVDDSVCAENYAEQNDLTTDRMICFGYEQGVKDACGVSKFDVLCILEKSVIYFREILVDLWLSMESWLVLYLGEADVQNLNYLEFIPKYRIQKLSHTLRNA